MKIVQLGLTNGRLQLKLNNSKAIFYVVGGYKKLKSFSNLEPDPRIPAISR